MSTHKMPAGMAMPDCAAIHHIVTTSTFENTPAFSCACQTSTFAKEGQNLLSESCRTIVLKDFQRTCPPAAWIKAAVCAMNAQASAQSKSMHKQLQGSISTAETIVEVCLPSENR